MHSLACDVPLGSHPAMYNLVEKYAKLRGQRPESVHRPGGIQDRGRHRRRCVPRGVGATAEDGCGEKVVDDLKAGITRHRRARRAGGRDYGCCPGADHSTRPKTQPGPDLGHRRMELLLVRRRARDCSREGPCATACRCTSSTGFLAGEASLSGGVDPRRLRPGLGLDQHSRRPPWLGHAAARARL